MERQRWRGSLPGRRTGRWRPTRLAVAGAALVLVERALVGEVGTPATLLGTLRHVGDAWVDPVGAVVALMALAAEILVAYLLAILVLQGFASLPGAMGRVAARTTALVTPIAARRGLELLLGGTLLAHSTLALVPAAPSGLRAGPASDALAACSTSTGSFQITTASGGGSARTALGPVPARDGSDPDTARPTPRRASAPLPPWLGGGPSNSSDDSDDAPPGADEVDAAGREAAASGSDRGAGRAGSRVGSAGRPDGHAGSHGDPGRGPAVGDHTVEPNDTLWDIAAARLAPADRSAANVHHYWQQVYRANRARIGDDPDLVHPGTRLAVPPYRRDRW